MEMPFPILARMVLREKEPVRTWRVVLVEAPNRAWLMPLDGSEWPHARDLSVLAQQLADGALTLELEDPFRASVLTTVTSTQLECRNQKRWERISDLVVSDRLSRLMRPEHRGALLKMQVEEKKVSYKVLSELLRRYWARGMTAAAVGVDYSGCGAPGQRRTLTKQPGPVATVAGPDGAEMPVPPFIVTPEVRDRFEIGIFLHKKKGFPIKLAYQNLIAQYWPDPALPAPTFRQFEYQLYQYHSAQERRREKMGPAAFNLGARALPGRVDDYIDGPGARFEIDATVGDVYLLSANSPGLIVGRPTVYFVVDTWSRLIVGLHVAFEPPSWINAVAALVNAVTPKKEFCAEYDCVIEEWEWPSRHLPAALLGDRGEMMSIRNGKNLIVKLHVDVQNTSPGRGDLKATVERDFGHVPKMFKALIPGWIRPDYRRRGERDYRESAVLSLRDYTAILIQAILEHNRTPTTSHEVLPGMVSDGLTGSPLHFWEWGIRNRTGRLAEWDVDSVALALLPVEQARLTAHGVVFHRGRYNCVELGELELLEAARVETVSIEVSFDPRCLDAIYYCDARFRRGYVRLDLERDSPHRGLSMGEVRRLASQARLLVRTETPRLLRRKVDANAKVAEIVAKAKARTEAVRDGIRPTPSELRGIRDNRIAELQATRPALAIDLGRTETSDTAPSPPPERESVASVAPERPTVLLRKKETAAERLMRQRAQRESD